MQSAQRRKLCDHAKEISMCRSQDMERAMEGGEEVSSDEVERTLLCSGTTSHTKSSTHTDVLSWFLPGCATTLKTPLQS